MFIRCKIETAEHYGANGWPMWHEFAYHWHGNSKEEPGTAWILYLFDVQECLHFMQAVFELADIKEEEEWKIKPAIPVLLQIIAEDERHPNGLLVVREKELVVTLVTALETSYNQLQEAP